MTNTNHGTDGMTFVMSWDDGHPEDLRVAEMLSDHDLRCTFYVPAHNGEGYPTMTPAELRQLDAAFEIGSHTYNHVMLSGLDIGAMEKEIGDGKRYLEDCLGHDVPGFCYPSGRAPAGVRDVLRRCGVAYSRTVECFRTDAGADPYAVPTTFQFYPHARSDLTKNLLRYGSFGKRIDVAMKALSSNDLTARAHKVIDHCQKHGSVFHLWGHSYEIVKLGLWDTLREIIGHVASCRPNVASVGQLVERTKCV